MSSALNALEALNLADWAPTRDEMWKLPASHIDGLHPEVARRLDKAVETLLRGRNPLAAVVRGERGSGKTHMLSWLRERIQVHDGYFFELKAVAGQAVWQAAVDDVFDGLLRETTDAPDQLTRLLSALTQLTRVDDATAAAVVGRRPLTREHLDLFIEGLRRVSRAVGIPAADTARALVLVASTGPVEVGRSYFVQPDSHDEDRAAWGIPGPRPAQLVLRDLTRLIALAGPIVFAFDQLDNLVHESNAELGGRHRTERRSARELRDDIATALMELREESRRTLIVVACHDQTWEIIKGSSLLSAQERFDVLPELGAIPDADTAARIVGARFAPHFARINFTPPYPTWPIAESALEEAPHRYTARRLLMRVADHVTACVAGRRTIEMTTLDRTGKPDPHPSPDPAPADESIGDLFDRLLAAADGGQLAESAEDHAMPRLLGAGLRSLLLELDVDPHDFNIDEDFGRSAALHARLRHVPDEQTGPEVHWSLRAIAAADARAFQSRLAKAMRESKLASDEPHRSLLIIRNVAYPRGPKTADMLRDFTARGGRDLVLNGGDLGTLAALRALLDQSPPGLQEWLRAERPAAQLAVFADIVRGIRPANPEPKPDEPATTATTTTEDDDIVLGETQRGGSPFTVTPAALRKHAVVIGSSGSGKTVLVKTIVEQCALRGISSIVLDPNDDLATLGDRWPAAPEAWRAGQHEAADRYFARTEVVVWTPGLSGGRPLSFHPLPDFGPVRDDPDDFSRLVRSTAQGLAAQARVTGKSPRALQQEAILVRALEHYAAEGGTGLAGFLELLTDLPDGIGDPQTAPRYAREMAATLEAATATDRLFREGGTPIEPAVLLTPSPGKGARVSVISMTGLDDETRLTLVSRLQAALFAYFRANPGQDGSLAGLLVMDEAQIFAPSQGVTVSLSTTQTLIAQARKYGLGMVLATQMPKGLHHSIPGNTASQFIGRLTVAAQLDAAERMAQARGGTLDRLARLSPGDFYATTEGTGFRRIVTPLCLSHHRSALSPEEILERVHRTQ